MQLLDEESNAAPSKKLNISFKEDYELDHDAVSCLTNYYAPRSLNRNCAESVLTSAVARLDIFFKRMGVDKAADERVWMLLSQVSVQKTAANEAVTSIICQKLFESPFYHDKITEIFPTLFSNENLTENAEKRFFTVLALAEPRLDKILPVTKEALRFLAKGYECLEPKNRFQSKIKEIVSRMFLVVLPETLTPATSAATPPVQRPTIAPGESPSPKKPSFLANMMKVVQNSPTPQRLSAAITTAAAPQALRAITCPTTNSPQILSFPAPTQMPLDEGILIGEIPPEDREKTNKQLQKITIKLQEIWDQYIEPNFEISDLLLKIKSRLPYLAKKLFVTEPRAITEEERQLLQRGVEGVGTFFEKLEAQRIGLKGSGVLSMKTLIEQMVVEKEKEGNLDQLFMAELSKTVEGFVNLESGLYSPQPNEGQYLVRDFAVFMATLLFEKLATPTHLKLMLQRILDDIDLETFEIERPLSDFSRYNCKNFSFIMGTKFKKIIDSFLVVVGGKSMLTDSALWFYDPLKVGGEFQSALNSVLGSKISMRPLLVLHHLLLFKEEGIQKKVLSDTDPAKLENLRENITSKIQSLILGKFPFLKFMVENNQILKNSVDLLISITENPKALKLVVIELLRSFR